MRRIGTFTETFLVRAMQPEEATLLLTDRSSHTLQNNPISSLAVEQSKVRLFTETAHFLFK